MYRLFDYLEIALSIDCSLTVISIENGQIYRLYDYLEIALSIDCSHTVISVENGQIYQSMITLK